MSTGRSVVSGAFLVVATQISRNQNVQIVPQGAGRNDENFQIQLLAYAEPKLKVLRAGNLIKLEEVVDDKGNSLIPAAGASTRAGFGYYGGNAGAWNLYAPLSYPKDAGTRIARLRASATFTIQTKSHLIEVADLPHVNEKIEAVGQTRVTVRKFAKEAGNMYRLTVVIARGDAGGDWESIQNSVHTRLKVVDAEGQALDSRGWGTSTRNDEMEITLNFAPSRRPEDARQSGDPVKMVWDIPMESRELTIPFEFTDLPLPR